MMMVTLGSMAAVRRTRMLAAVVVVSWIYMAWVCEHYELLSPFFFLFFLFLFSLS